MSLYGMMHTGSSGMNAQANRLSAVGENIANANTVGYKRVSTEFATMLLPATTGAYNSGGVQTSTRYSISESGATNYTTSSTDMAIDGNGFFIATDQNGKEFLTRAGAFTQDENGNLVNTAGYTLMGYKYVEGQPPTMVVNGFDGLMPINLSTSGLAAQASTKGGMGANLPASAAVGDSYKTSLSAFDSQGTSHLLDFNYTKTGANAWSVDVVDRDSGTSIGTKALTFAADGSVSTVPTTFTTTALAVPATGATLEAIEIDLIKTTQLGYPFNPDGGSINGNAAAKVKGVNIDRNGILYFTYDKGDPRPVFRVAMANVQSPDKLIPQSGNVYSQGPNSGVVVTGFAGEGLFGSIIAGAVETSNVDIATELTTMIEAQRSYTANSKVFQTGSDLLDVLVNLKR
ncbi:flagellar hook protein FlgE [Rhizobium sp. RU20A]|uniref:flagellar hook protein FlgE n=1 Tax=Rhizobium sp. RU20A TaxID=1907412 RepID=UPI000953CB83|nr:flagellar hook protein FlgE [Rhizobium sp. RU20A]SIQ55483.1 flagellar hook protein FlgE [Rhizobium sp. RU20A]